MTTSDWISLVSLLVSILSAGYTFNIKKSFKQSIKGKKNITAGKDVNYK